MMTVNGALLLEELAWRLSKVMIRVPAVGIPNVGNAVGSFFFLDT